MGFIKEFKEFALKGNLVDMAVGIVVGTAFAGIVKSFMDNIVSPLIGSLLKVPDMSGLTLKIGTMENDKGETIDALLNWGSFIQTCMDFLIVALAVFVAIKVMNSMQKKEEEAPAGPSEEVKLLTEIRDALKK